MLTEEIALSLRRGAKLYSNLIEFGEGKIPAVAVVIGKPKRLSGPDKFSIPVRRQYGAGETGQITGMGAHLWRTTPEKAEEDTVKIAEVSAPPRRAVMPPKQPESAPVLRSRIRKPPHCVKPKKGETLYVEL